MKDQILNWLKTYGGWIIAGILLMIMLYTLLKPISIPDNSALEHKVDSVTKENGVLKRKLAEVTITNERRIDSVDNVNEKLNFERDNLGNKVEYLLKRNGTLYNEYQYAKKQGDKAREDSLCDECFKQHHDDSATVALYMQKTNLLIFNSNQKMISLLAINESQKDLIASDSTVIEVQKTLIAKQKKDINQLARKNKTATWIARSFGIIIIGLTGALIAK